ncbi:MAG: TerB N-terminal domain-containing protein [Pseudomonadota bacterium]
MFWLAVMILAGIFVYRWDRERRTARIIYDVDNDEIVSRLALCNAAGESLAKARSLWRIHSSNRTALAKYHAGANTLLERRPTRCAPGAIKGIELNIEPWAITVGSQEFLLLPDRLLVREGKQLAAVPYEWMSSVHANTTFIEEGPVPSDSKTVGATWRFVNKSGGPDLRFNNNRQLPVLEYGELTLRSASGLNTVLQASAPAATWYAASALQELARMASTASAQPQQADHPLTGPPPGLVPRPSAPPGFLPVPSAPPGFVPRRSAPPGFLPMPSAPPGFVPRPSAPPLGSPPSPSPRQAFVPAPPAHSTRRFLGTAEVLSVAGRTIARPLTFASSTAIGSEASTIVTSLPVGDARHAGPLPYWPSYSEADLHQRARYLDWMAGGRTDPAIDIGYVFIFFYGLEWRALREGLDVEAACQETFRLLAIYGPRNGSFRSYAANFLLFAMLTRLDTITDEQEFEGVLEHLLETSMNGSAVLTAWYFRRGLPLPARYAVKLAPTLEGAKRSVVAKRAEHELSHLFAARYREALGNGLPLTAAKRELSLAYRGASSSWHRAGSPLAVSIPDVLGKWGQFKPLVRIWNQCIEDLRKAARLKEKSGELSAEAWAALPAELRAQYDHPDRDRWDDLVAGAPRLGAFHLVTGGALAELAGAARTEKLSAALLCKITETAAELGYALEPDARAQRKGLRWQDEMLIWPSEETSCPDPKLYSAAYILLSLSMQVAMADGALAEEEAYVVISMLTDTFTLDETLRKRFVALQHLLARQPVRAATLAKKLQSTRTSSELAKIGRVLVSVATADGVVTDQEHAALRSLYKALGLSAADLGAAMVASGITLASDAVVDVRSGTGVAAPGEPIPPPPKPAPGVALDQAAIAAIIADTRDVAALLADVFDQEGDDDDPSLAVTPAPKSASHDAVSSEIKAVAQGLDARYHAVLADLLSKPRWTREEIRSLALTRKLMPGAILETINTWSEETYGDFLIDEADTWQIHSELLQGQST